ncbi:hypothetical protein Ferp_1926 [Ferroglobus placidus DSM 10642]|uniref:DUF1616 domain-containing protein n=1 Tax=Ferroglobus placidus (strain DSM 10642 / AEDII12DO) TaxID=589924 RepID=D3S001_FERPA|nr:hypothetical protein [Ferroglobus placidus]ADC66064.1 hypothetical protein Ferp_1926 [Ferroglobus placidus DSM 10642]
MNENDDIIPEKTGKLMLKALIAATILSVVLMSYLLWVSSQERYTTIYIYPDSYTNYAKPGSVVKFKYGIYCHEGKETEYLIKVYLGEKLVKSKEIMLKNGESREENESIVLPQNISLPVKVRVEAVTENSVYDAYFWIKASKE